MNDKHYGKFVSILSLTAFVLTLSPLPLPFLDLLKIKPEVNFFGYLLRFSWVLGLVLAIVSLILAKRFKDESEKIFAGRFSSYAIGISLFWILAFIAVLLSRGHYR